MIMLLCNRLLVMVEEGRAGLFAALSKISSFSLVISVRMKLRRILKSRLIRCGPSGQVVLYVI